MRKERQGRRTRFGDHNRAVAERNAEREAIGQELRHLEAEIIELARVRAERQQATEATRDGARSAEQERQSPGFRRGFGSLDQAQEAAEIGDPDAWRRGLDQGAPETPGAVAQRPEAERGSEAPAPENTTSDGRKAPRERGFFGRAAGALRRAGEAALDWVAPRVAMPEPPAQEDAQARDAERRQKEEKAQADYDLMLRMYAAMNAAHDRAREGDRLHDRYQAERNAAWAERAAAETDVRIRHIAQDREQRVGHARQFADLKNSRLRGPERRQAAQKIVEQVRADRAATYGVLQQKLAEVRHAYPVPKWGEWLAREEAAGDKKAGRALERHKAREAERGYTEETIPLYQDYEAERERAHLKQEAALKAVDERFSGIAAERQRFWDGRFAEERARALPGELKHDAIISVRIAQRRDRVAQREQWKRARQEARDQNPVLNWDQYLEREAACGNQDAKRALEARQRRREARTQEREDDELEH
jgi:hypothetical protein